MKRGEKMDQLTRGDKVVVAQHPDYTDFSFKGQERGGERLLCSYGDDKFQFQRRLDGAEIYMIVSMIAETSNLRVRGTEGDGEAIVYEFF